MYYDEKVIDGVLCCRTEPRGKWRPVKGGRGDAFAALMNLSIDDRESLLAHFCGHCGRQDSGCQCWNDD